MKNKDNKNIDYSFYSRLLKEPFDSIEELKEAEEAYYAKQKAKEDKIAQKRADAQKVEDAFKALNAARKTFKDEITALTEEYRDNLNKLKELFEKEKAEIQEYLAKHEDAYSAALKEFTEKYPEGFHLTLKDGDFETTISGSTKTSEGSKKPVDAYADLFKLIFGI